MKNRILLLILVLVLSGIFLFNIQTQVKAVKATIHAEQTLGLVFGLANEALEKMTSAELSLLYRRCGSEDIRNATRLIELWGSLLRVATESGEIINERFK